MIFFHQSWILYHHQSWILYHLTYNTYVKCIDFAQIFRPLIADKYRRLWVQFFVHELWWRKWLDVAAAKQITDHFKAWSNILVTVRGRSLYRVNRSTSGFYEPLSRWLCYQKVLAADLGLLTSSKHQRCISGGVEAPKNWGVHKSTLSCWLEI